MQSQQVNGVVTLKGFGADKSGNVTAQFAGDTGIVKVVPVVGDHWREYDIGAQYIVETVITPAQATIPDVDGQTSIDYDDDEETDADDSYLLPAYEGA